MLKAAILIATFGAEVSVPIIQTDGAEAAQFDLLYDAEALEFLRWDDEIGTDIENPQPGRFRYIAAQTAGNPLPEELGRIVFRVLGPSDLIFENVLLVTFSDGQPNDLGVSVENGRIELTMANVTFAWTDNIPASFGVTEYELRVSSSGPDPAVDTFDPVGRSPVGTPQLSTTIAENVGVRWYYAVALYLRFGRLVETVPSNVLPVNTNEAPPLETLRIV